MQLPYQKKSKQLKRKNVLILHINVKHIKL